MGIRDKPIAPASPWQNGVVERLIGSIRRECGPHHCPGRGTSAPDSEILRSLLQKDADALGIGQGCAGFSLGSANRCGQVTCHPRRTSSPLRPSLSFWYTQPSRNETNSSRVNVGADKTWAIRRICAYGWPVQASHPATIKLIHYPDPAGWAPLMLRSFAGGGATLTARRSVWGNSAATGLTRGQAKSPSWLQPAGRPPAAAFDNKA